jgi:hypothetical protein
VNATSAARNPASAMLERIVDAEELATMLVLEASAALAPLAAELLDEVAEPPEDPPAEPADEPPADELPEDDPPDAPTEPDPLAEPDAPAEPAEPAEPAAVEFETALGIWPGERFWLAAEASCLYALTVFSPVDFALMPMTIPAWQCFFCEQYNQIGFVSLIMTVYVGIIEEPIATGMKPEKRPVTFGMFMLMGMHG